MAKAAWRRAFVGLSAPWALAGFALVPRSQLDECHRLARGQEVENARLKDSVLTLRGENRDLSRRALDDSKRIASLEEANQALERSVVAYQRDRDKIAAGYDRLRSELQATPPPRQASRD